MTVRERNVDYRHVDQRQCPRIRGWGRAAACAHVHVHLVRRMLPRRGFVEPRVFSLPPSICRPSPVCLPSGRSTTGPDVQRLTSSPKLVRITYKPLLYDFFLILFSLARRLHHAVQTVFSPSKDPQVPPSNVCRSAPS